MFPFSISILRQQVIPGIMVMDVIAIVLSTPVQIVAGSKFIHEAYKVGGTLMYMCVCSLSSI